MPTEELDIATPEETPVIPFSVPEPLDSGVFVVAENGEQYELTGVESAFYTKITDRKRQAEFIEGIARKRERRAAELADIAKHGSKNLVADANGDLMNVDAPTVFAINDGHRRHLQLAESDPIRYERVIDAIARTNKISPEQVKAALLDSVIDEAPAE